MVRKAYTQITEDDYKIFNLKTYCLNRNIFEEFLPMRDTNNSSFAAIRGERIIGLPSLIFKDENFPLWFYLPNRLEDTYIGLYNLKSDLENNKMKEIFYNYEISQRMERPVLGTDFLLHNGIALQYNSYDTITYSLNEKKEIVKIEENTPYQVTRDILLPELRILEVGNKQSLFHLFGPIHRASQTLTPTDEDRASLISLYSFNW
jgi:glutaredoxin-related protein